MKHKPTSFDIAHLAGVSQSTVSRALNDSPLVNIATRQKVQEIARELNYQVDKNASNLRRQRSSTIALLLFVNNLTDKVGRTVFSLGHSRCPLIIMFKLNT